MPASALTHKREAQNPWREYLASTVASSPRCRWHTWPTKQTGVEIEAARAASPRRARPPSPRDLSRSRLPRSRRASRGRARRPAPTSGARARAPARTGCVRAPRSRGSRTCRGEERSWGVDGNAGLSSFICPRESAARRRARARERGGAPRTGASGSSARAGRRTSARARRSRAGRSCRPRSGWARCSLPRR